MTPSPDDHLDDEQLSAGLDGERGPGHQSHLDACARCRSRSGVLAQAAALVGTPPRAPDGPDRERVIAAALAAGPGSGASGGPGTPTRTRRRRPPPWLLPAAAVVALLAAVVALIPATADDSTDEALTEAGTSPDAATESEGGAALRGEEGASGGGEPPADLGAVDDEAGLRAALAASDERDADQRGAEVEGPSSCAAALRTARPGLGERRTAARLRWQGVPAVVGTYGTGDGAVAVVTALDDCRLLVEVAVPG